MVSATPSMVNIPIAVFTEYMTLSAPCGFRNSSNMGMGYDEILPEGIVKNGIVCGSCIICAINRLQCGIYEPGYGMELEGGGSSVLYFKGAQCGR